MMNAEQATAPPDEAVADDNGIGERVNAVFTAAEKAAQHILTMAREEGEDIRRQAWSPRRSRSSHASRPSGVERILADAHAQADVIKSEAEAQARKVVDDGRRKERLREEARLIEDRIVWAHEGLREVSARLAEGRSDPLDGPETDSAL